VASLPEPAWDVSDQDDAAGAADGHPIVALNRAVAAAMVHRPPTGFALLDAVGGQLSGHHRLDAVRAHLLELAGDREAALTHYRAAASGTTSLPEQRYLATRAARLKTKAVPT
jgi:predicted RNA polymerase sigma factor